MMDIFSRSRRLALNRGVPLLHHLLSLEVFRRCDGRFGALLSMAAFIVRRRLCRRWQYSSYLRASAVAAVRAVHGGDAEKNDRDKEI